MGKRDGWNGEHKGDQPNVRKAMEGRSWKHDLVYEREGSKTSNSFIKYRKRDI